MYCHFPLFSLCSLCSGLFKAFTFLEACAPCVIIQFPILTSPLMSNVNLSTQLTPSNCREGELNSLTIHLPWAQSKYVKRHLSINLRRTNGKWSASKVGGDIDGVDQILASPLNCWRSEAELAWEKPMIRHLDSDSTLTQLMAYRIFFCIMFLGCSWNSRKLILNELNVLNQSSIAPTT